jgi:hypothetical protein
MMIPYNDPRDLWPVHRAELERTYARVHLERLARQARRAAPDGMSPPHAGPTRIMLGFVRCVFHLWLAPLEWSVSTASHDECCQELV